MYINDLPNHVQNEVRIFADDTKIFKEVDEKGKQGDPYKNEAIMKTACPLQEDLDRLFDWSNTWLLKFHPEKCCTMRIGRSTEDNS